MRASFLLLGLLVMFSASAVSCVPTRNLAGSGTQPSGFSGRYALALPEFGTPVTPDEVREAYVRYGAAAVIRKLHTDNAANWTVIMNRIAAGDPAWIACFTECILPGADGEAGDDIFLSLAYGLQNNPEAVLLSGVERGVSMDAVCSAPFDEPDRGFMEKYGERALSALRKIDKPRLLGARNDCIRTLRDSLGRDERAHAAGRL